MIEVAWPMILGAMLFVGIIAGAAGCRVGYARGFLRSDERAEMWRGEYIEMQAYAHRCRAAALAMRDRILSSELMTTGDGVSVPDLPELGRPWLL